jgi:hypothetical protein
MNETMPEQDARYDVALSLAGKERPYVEQVAADLRRRGITLFYDDYEKATFWGRDLYTHLDWVYRIASRYCVMFISESYANKVWTNHERASAQARALSENSEYVLPARFDDTEIPGLLPTIGYVDLRHMKPDELAGLIQEKLGPRRLAPGFPPRVDRLIKGLAYKGSTGEKKRKNQEARDIAYSFYNAMSRMTRDERRAVAGVFAFGCRAELPAGVHISLNLLSRKTRLPEAQLLDLIRSTRPLNFKAILRDPPHPQEPGELVADDKDLLLQFWSTDVPHSKDATRVAYVTVSCASNHFCEDHGLEVVTHLDFHRLSSAESGPLIFPDEDHARSS